MKIIIFTLFLTSCASYVDNLHRQIDRAQAQNNPRSPVNNDPFSSYRQNQGTSSLGDKRPINNPVTYQRSLQNAEVPPPVKREYRDPYQRTKASDLLDNSSNGSLWASNSSPSLFTADPSKKPGDLVIINVLEKLRTQISTELKRAFPPLVAKKAEGEQKQENEQQPQASPNPQAPGAAGSDNEIDTKVYDKISGLVTEEINRDYLLVKGKKEVIFRRNKHLIEVHALVPRRNIDETDNVNSDKLLESKVVVLR